MTEEVRERTFSEMQAGDGRKVPENLYVLKRANVPYNQYWSEEKGKYGPLIEATYYTERPTEVKQTDEIVDYRKEVNIR